MASEREKALYPEESRTLCTARSLRDHLYWPIMSDKSESGKCYAFRTSDYYLHH